MYKLLEHESEIGIEACGSTIEEAFSEASKGLFSVMAGIDKVQRMKSIHFECKSDKIDELLIECANKLVFIMSKDDMLFSDFEYKIITDDNDKEGKYTAECDAYGENIDFSRHTLHVEVKAVTYSGLKVWKDTDSEAKTRHCVRFIADI